MRIAIIHEMLVKLWWAEKVTESFLKIFPDADLFTLIYDEKKVSKIFPKTKIDKQVFSLKSQKIYNLSKNQRLCLAFMASSVEELDFSKYDIVIACSSWFAHGAITKPETKFIVYYNSPARYMRDWTNEYKKDIWWDKWIKWYLLNKFLLKLRQWDYIASNRVDIVLANSRNTSDRIKKYYRKESQIIYPPVETERFQKVIKKEAYKQVFKEYYIIVSALTEFKKINVAIEAFNKMKDKNLVIIWDWNYKKELEAIINKKDPDRFLSSQEWQKSEQQKWQVENIIFVWAKFWDELVYLVQSSLGLIFPWEEDFWIVPIEIMATWKPVFALKKWWLKETILEWITWEFFEDENWSDFAEKFLDFDKKNKDWFYKKEACQKQASKFDEKIFEEKIKEIVFSK